MAAFKADLRDHLVGAIVEVIYTSVSGYVYRINGFYDNNSPLAAFGIFFEAASLMSRMFKTKRSSGTEAIA